MGVNLVPIVRNFSIETTTFAQEDHDLLDGCVSVGQHRLLRFDFLTNNIGDNDLQVGRPEDHPEWFVFSGAHGHFHFVGFNKYSLLDLQGQEVVPGFKQAFCLEDAIAAAKQGLTTDLVTWQLETISGVNGGFVGVRDLTVTILAQR